MSRPLLSPVTCHSFLLAAHGAGTSHLVENLVDRLAEIQATEQPVHWVAFTRSLPQKDDAVTKLELHDRSRRQSKLFAQLYRNRELPLGGDRALHRE